VVLVNQKAMPLYFSNQPVHNFLKYLPLAKDITHAELALLLEGSRYVIEKKVKPYQKPVDQKKSSFESRPTTSPSRGQAFDESPIN
jgi:hypothetical protein